MAKDKQRREARKPKKKKVAAPPAPAIRVPVKDTDKRT
jgi:hypothetical protein